MIPYIVLPFGFAAFLEFLDFLDIEAPPFLSGAEKYFIGSEAYPIERFPSG